LYQSKEWQSDLDLGIYDFEWRGYDPVLGRTWQPDPHAESYFSLSPYSWAGNNPINFADPTGLDTVSVQDLPDTPFDPENDVVMLDEVEVVPTNEHGVHQLEMELGDDKFVFTEFGDPLYAKDNTIENYLYWLWNQDKFFDEQGNLISVNEIFKSEKERKEDITEDILLEVADIFAKGAASSTDATQELRKRRRSKYANRFPSNSEEFKEKKEDKINKIVEEIQKAHPYIRTTEDFRYKP